MTRPALHPTRSPLNFGWRTITACTIAILFALLPMVLGCGLKGSPAKGDSAPVGQGFVLHIGHQRGDTLHLLKARGTLEKRLRAQGIRVDWLLFPAGPQLLEALSVGSIAFGTTGESPPIFAQAAGRDIVYVANIPPSGDYGEGQAVIVPKNSPLRTAADLKGRTIAFQKGSSAHNFVLQVVERAGLKYQDIHPVFLAPPDARPAFDAGRVDAWAVWDPFLAVAETKTDARVLVDSNGILTPGNFYLSSRKFASEHGDLLKIVLDELQSSSDWAAAHREEANQLLSRAAEMDIETVRMLGKRRPRLGVRPIGADVVKAQQTIADNFYRIGILPKKIDIRAALLNPDQYAGLLSSK